MTDGRNPVVAAVQMCSGADLGRNLESAARLVGEAVAEGAELVVLPEYFPFMGMKERDKYAITEAPEEGPIQQFLSDLAASQRCWLVGGTMPVRSDDAKRPYGRCLLIDPSGNMAASYDKMHLFDVEVADNMRRYVESAICMPGSEPVVAETPWGGLGLAVCYDLRFPELFRCMVDLGARIIALPSAFTATTGEAHWEILLRARAIEQQCFLIASAQGGKHQNGRETWGRSMVIDPWGRVLALQEEGEGVALATLDLAEQDRIRSEFPSLQHRVL